jgi:hypothetical protein
MFFINLYYIQRVKENQPIKGNKMKKGLLVTVYRGSSDCTNNGISKNYDQLILIGEGVPEIFEPNETTPAIYLEKRYFGRETILSAKPNKPGKHQMFGGNFIYTSDSRFPSDAPIKVHDRVEG